MTSDFEGFLSQILSITFFVLSLFFRKSQYFPFKCWVPNKGTTGTTFITSLVWRGPWLGIEPGTSRTRSQQSTTRLSRRRYYRNELMVCTLIYLVLLHTAKSTRRYPHFKSDTAFCSYNLNWCVRRFIVKLVKLFLTVLNNVSEISKNIHTMCWIKPQPF